MSKHKKSLPTDRELLAAMSSMTSVEATIPYATAHDSGEVPLWCEVVLTMEREDKIITHYLRRSDGELICEVLREVLHPTMGVALHMRIRDLLDAEVARIMGNTLTKKEKLVAIGRAQGLGESLARFENPYHPNLDNVRDQAMVRWQERHGG
jgi:hypothetical protein